MTDARILAGDLLANLEARTVSGLLVPFGEVGHTNLGQFEIPGPGVITLPRDISTLQANEEISRDRAPRPVHRPNRVRRRHPRHISDRDER